MKVITRKISRTFLLFAVFALSTAATAQKEHQHHQNKHKHPHASDSAASAAAQAAVPSLKILMPETGDIVGSQLAVVFETPANLSSMTMSAPVVGVHLHIGYDDTSLMPTIQQLVRLGKDRYLYLFDLPVTPGAKTLRVYWSDAQHKTMESTMQSVSVIVAPDTSK